MTTKHTKGYTKSITGKFDLYKMLTEKVFKDPNEPFEDWFNRKTNDAFYCKTFNDDGMATNDEKCEVQCENCKLNS